MRQAVSSGATLFVELSWSSELNLLLNELGHSISYNTACARSTDLDQPANQQSTKSDQSLLCILWIAETQIILMWPKKTLIRLRGCAG